MPAGTRKPKTSRNPFIGRGIEKHSRTASFKRAGVWAKKNKKAVVPTKLEKKAVTKKFGKKGESRTIVPKTPRFYPTEDVKRPLTSNKHNHRPTRLRSSIKPGTVLIVLAGRFRGKRVVFVKQLPSGLLLVTGNILFSLYSSLCQSDTFKLFSSFLIFYSRSIQGQWSSPSTNQSNLRRSHLYFCGY
jgi:large subunit ribosomal protein L6e